MQTEPQGPRVFSVAPERVRSLRRAPLFLLGLGGIFALGGFYYFIFNPDGYIGLGPRLIVLGVTLLGAAIPIAKGVIARMGIPPDLDATELRIDAEGLEVTVSGTPSRLEWREINALEDDHSALGSRHRTDGAPAALLLAHGTADIGDEQKSRLRKALRQMMATPLRRGAVTLVPLVLFTAADARAILAAAQEAHAAATDTDTPSDPLAAVPEQKDSL